MKSLLILANIAVSVGLFFWFCGGKRFRKYPINFFSLLYMVPMLLNGAVMVFLSSSGVFFGDEVVFKKVDPSDLHVNIYFFTVLLSILAVPAGTVMGEFLGSRLTLMAPSPTKVSVLVSRRPRRDRRAALVFAGVFIPFAGWTLQLIGGGIWTTLRNPDYYLDILGLRRILVSDVLTWVHFVPVYTFFPLLIVYYVLRLHENWRPWLLGIVVFLITLTVSLTLSLTLKYPLMVLTVSLFLSFNYDRFLGGQALSGLVKKLLMLLPIVGAVLFVLFHLMHFGRLWPSLDTAGETASRILYRLFAGGESYNLLYGITYYTDTKITKEMLQDYNVSYWVSIAVEGKPEWAFGRAGPSMMHSYATSGLLVGTLVCVGIHTAYGVVETILRRYQGSLWLRACLITLMACAFWPWAAEGLAAVHLIVRPFIFAFMMWLLTAEIRIRPWQTLLCGGLFLYYVQGIVKTLFLGPQG